MGFLLGLPLAPLVRPTRLAPGMVTTARICNLVRRTIDVKNFVAPQNGSNPGKIRQAQNSPNYGKSRILFHSSAHDLLKFTSS
jgi:ubiquinone biosynthesis protein COQ9